MQLNFHNNGLRNTNWVQNLVPFKFVLKKFYRTCLKHYCWYTYLLRDVIYSQHHTDGMVLVVTLVV
jgi:hypothetical protein